MLKTPPSAIARPETAPPERRTNAIASWTDLLRDRASASRLAPHLALLLCLLIWSLNATVIKIGLTHVRPIPFTALRFGLAGVVLLALVRLRGGSIRPPRMSLVIPGALTGIVVNQLAFTEGVHLSTAVDISLIMGLSPILTALLFLAVAGQRLPLSQWVALGIGFGGTLLVVGAARAGGGSLLGDLIGIGAPASWAAYLLIVARDQGRTPALLFSAWSMLIGVAVLIPAAVFLGGPGRDDWGSALGPILYASLFASALCWTLYFWALPRVGVTGTVIYTYLQPPMGAGFGALILHEAVGILQAAGAAAILLAAYLGSWRQPRGRESS